MADISKVKLPNGNTYDLASYKLLSSDTRSNNQLPSWYMSNYPKCTVEEFKSCNAIGVNSIISGTYCVLNTIIPWNDSSGGRPIQIAVSDSGIRAQRVATADNTWGSWVKLPNSDTNTTYSMTRDGSSVKLTPSSGTAQSIPLSDLINGLGEGTSPAQTGDYLVAQFAGGGTTTTTYHRRTVANVVNSTVVKAALGTGSGTTKYLREDGTWQVPPDTKNTAGSTDTSSKIFLVGATSQAANPQTYSDNEVFVTSGVLTTKSVQVGGGSATLQYNVTTQAIDFVFA